MHGYKRNPANPTSPSFSASSSSSFSDPESSSALTAPALRTSQDKKLLPKKEIDVREIAPCGPHRPMSPRLHRRARRISEPANQDTWSLSHAGAAGTPPKVQYLYQSCNCAKEDGESGPHTCHVWSFDDSSLSDHRRGSPKCISGRSSES